MKYILLKISSNKMEEEKKWNIYMVTMKNGNIYTGISNNILKDLKHIVMKKALMLRGKGPLKLSWFSKANYSQCGSRCDKM